MYFCVLLATTRVANKDCHILKM